MIKTILVLYCITISFIIYCCAKIKDNYNAQIKKRIHCRGVSVYQMKATIYNWTKNNSICNECFSLSIHMVVGAIYI